MSDYEENDDEENMRDDYFERSDNDDYDNYEEANDDDIINLNKKKDDDDEGIMRGEEVYELGDDDEDDIIQEDELVSEKYEIDPQAEWRNSNDSPDKSRVGMARGEDIEEDIGTTVADERFKKIEKMTRTPEDFFRATSNDIKRRYKLTQADYNNSIAVMNLINKHNKGLKYKSPQAIILALLVFTNKKIDKNKLNSVYEDMAVNENMTKIDLLRYAIFIENLRKL
jgi:hypothetical protein